VETAATTQAADLRQAFAGAEYLNNVKTGSTDAAIAVRFDGASVSLRTLVAADGDSEVLTGDGVGASILERVRVTVQKRNRVDQVTLTAAGKVTVESDGKEVLAN